MNEEKKIQIPHKDSWIGKEIDISKGLVIVGANGAGKTRLGCWIEQKCSLSVLRIDAQRILKMPEENNVPSNKELIRRFEGNADVKVDLQNFEFMMLLLFKDYYTEANRYIEEVKAFWDKKEMGENPDQRPYFVNTYFHILKGIWENCLPDKELIIESDKIMVKSSNSSGKYNASEMSDGERVIFYLIGQCLLYSEKSQSILIDEPENHLHKSIRSKFWDEIEAQRTDCKFIYITHDTDFAASRTKAKKIWLKSYHCTQDDKGQIISEAWDWEEIEENKDLPENLLLELLGARKPVLFVEGVYDSFDYRLYNALFPDLLIKPVSGCEVVKNAVRLLLKKYQEFYIQPFGLIDRDLLEDDKIDKLKEGSIYVLSVTEIENLICVPEILKLLNWEDEFKKKFLESSKTKKRNIKRSNFLNWLMGNDKKRDAQINKCFKQIMELNLGSFFKEIAKKEEKEAIFDKENIKEFISKNIENFYKQASDKVGKFFPEDDKNSITEEQYKKILKFYNGKDLAEKIAQELGFKGGKKELFNALIDYINESKDNRQKAIKALSPYLNGLVEAIEEKLEK